MIKLYTFCNIYQEENLYIEQLTLMKQTGTWNLVIVLPTFKSKHKCVWSGLTLGFGITGKFMMLRNSIMQFMIKNNKVQKK